MKVQKEKHPSGVVLLTLRGDFDSSVVEAFNAVVADLVAAGDARIALNMLRVKFLNSTAIGSMIKAHKACKAAGGALAISQASESVREPIELTKLDDVFTMYPDDAAAVAALSGPGRRAT